MTPKPRATFTTEPGHWLRGYWTVRSQHTFGPLLADEVVGHGRTLDRAYSNWLLALDAAGYARPPIFLRPRNPGLTFQEDAWAYSRGLDGNEPIPREMIEPPFGLDTGRLVTDGFDAYRAKVDAYRAKVDGYARKTDAHLGELNRIRAEADAALANATFGVRAEYWSKVFLAPESPTLAAVTALGPPPAPRARWQRFVAWLNRSPWPVLIALCLIWLIGRGWRDWS